MKELLTLFRKQGFPAVALVIGLALLLAAVATNQNAAVLIGCVAIIVAAILSAVAAQTKLPGAVIWSLFAVLFLGSAYLVVLNVMSIKTEVDTINEWEKREDHIVQRLMDIRAAQQAYKFQYGRFTGSFDTLINFLKHDSITMIKATGTVPDSLAGDEERAIELGLVKRDTFLQSPLESNYMKEVFEERVHDFHADSLRYIPFQGKHNFAMSAGAIFRGKVKVQVFEAKDTVPFFKGVETQVGSMTEPSLAGNWE